MTLKELVVPLLRAVDRPTVLNIQIRGHGSTVVVLKHIRADGLYPDRVGVERRVIGQIRFPRHVVDAHTEVVIILL